MHTHETLKRINEEWPHPQSAAERREAAIKHLEARIGISVDRSDPMIGAMAALEIWGIMQSKQDRH